MTFKLYVVM